VLLPDGDGVDLLREIRETTSAHETAIMLLSTEAEVRDRIRGLTTGADEYVGKPYEPSYVVARARELLRHGQDAATSEAETILLIDDSVTFREALREALEQCSYRVIVAGSGEDGLRWRPTSGRRQSSSTAFSRASTALRSFAASGSTPRFGGCRACC